MEKKIPAWDIQTRMQEAMWRALGAMWNDPIMKACILLALALFCFFIVFNVLSMIQDKREERRAAEDRLRRQRAYEEEFSDLPETERRIKVMLALQADLMLPRIERRAARLTD